MLIMCHLLNIWQPVWMNFYAPLHKSEAAVEPQNKGHPGASGQSIEGVLFSGVKNVWKDKERGCPFLRGSFVRGFLL